MLAWVAAACEEDSESRRREVGRLAEHRRRLQVTFRHPLKPGQELLRVAVSLDGRRLVTASDDVVVWDTDSGRRLATIEHPGPVYYMAINATGTRVATLVDDGLRVWASDGRLLMGPDEIGEGGWDALALSPAGERVAVGGRLDAEHGMVWLFAVEPSAPWRADLPCPDPVWDVVFSPDGRHLASGSGGPRLWDAYDGTLVGEPVPAGDAEDDSPWHVVAFNTSGSILAVASDWSGVLRTWDIAAGEFRGPALPAPLANFVAFDAAHGRWVTAGNTASCGSDAITGGPAGRALVQDGLADEWAEKYGGNPGALSPDGTRLAIPGRGGSVRVWDTFTGERLTPVAWHGAVVEAVTFTGDARLVTWSLDGVVRMWSTETLEPMPRPAGDYGPDVYLAPGAEHALIVRATGDVRLAGLGGGSRSLEHDGVPLYDVAVSADGSVLAATAEDSSTRLWRLPSGRPLGETLYQNAWAWDLALDRTGRRLAVGTNLAAQSYDVERGERLELAAIDAERVGFDAQGGLLCGDGTRVFEVQGASVKRVVSGGDESHILALDGAGYLRLEHEVVFVDGEGEAYLVGHLAPTADSWEAGAGRVLALEEDRIVLIDPVQGEVVAILDHAALVGVAIAGGQVATWGDQSVKLWGAHDGLLLGERRHGFDLHAATPIPGADFIAMVTTAGSIQVLDARTGEKRGAPLRFDREVLGVTFDGPQRAILVDAAGRVLGVDLSTGRAGPLLELGPAQVMNVAVSSDGSRLAALLAPNEIRLLNLLTGQTLGEWKFEGSANLSAFYSYRGFSAEWPMGFDPTGSKLLVATNGSVSSGPGMSSGVPNDAFIVDAGTGVTICELSMPPRSRIGPVAFDSSGQRLAMALRHRTPDGFVSRIGVWDTQTGDHLHEIDFGAMDGTLAFIPGTRVLAVADDHGGFGSWDADSGNEVFSPISLRHRGGGETLSPDGRYLHAVDVSGVVHLFDLLSGETRFQMADIPRHLYFGPRQDEVLLFGEFHAHLARIEGGRLIPIATRAAHLHGGVDYLSGPRAGRALRADGTAVIGAIPNNEGAELVLRDFRNARADPIAGSLDELRAVWSRRLGLEFTSDGEIHVRK